jgi:NAD(P)H-flavin reductase
VKAALNSPKDSIKINLIYSNSTLGDVLFKNELIELSKLHPDRFKLHFTLTRQKEDVPKGWSSTRIDEKMIK